jgi:hypothetical protein
MGEVDDKVDTYVTRREFAYTGRNGERTEGRESGNLTFSYYEM